MNIKEAIELGTKMLKTIRESGYPELWGWRIVSNKRKRSFGVCNYGRMEISLSSYLVPHMTEKAIKDTIIHEIAHALTRGHHHDNVWKRKCIELGGNGERVGGAQKYVNNDWAVVHKSISKYTLICPTCNSTIYRNRLPNRKFSCSNHGRFYNPQHEFKIITNY